MRTLVGLSVALVSLVLVGPSQAQDPIFNVTGLENSCASGSDACANIVGDILAQLAALNLSPDDYSLQLAILASTLVDVAKGADASQWAAIMAALTLVGDAATDPGQRALIYVIADQVGNGEANDIDTSDPANPSAA